MALNVTTQPVYEPVSVEDVKSHLNLTHNDDDIYILQLIKAAREYVENATNRSLIEKTYVWKRDHWQWCFHAPRNPLTEVVSIQYVDSNGDTQTLAASEYQVDTDSEPGRIAPAYGETWPSIRHGVFNPVTITFKAGHETPTAVAKELRQVLLLMVGHLYMAREPVVTGTIVQEVPKTIDDLIFAHRVWL